MIVSLVVAMDKNREIGNDNIIPWNIPADRNFFTAVTMHHPVIMGRKTHESIGRALPNRVNIVVTRQGNYETRSSGKPHPRPLPEGEGGVEESIIVPDLTAAFEKAMEVERQEIFVIGGAEIFTQAMPVADKLYITEIDGEFPGDAHFPEINLKEWELKETKALANGLTSGYTIFFKTYIRRK